MSDKGTLEESRKSPVDVVEEEENFLNLENVLDPEVIYRCKINGKWYDYARRDLWSLKTRATWAKYWKRLETIETKINEGHGLDNESDLELYEDAIVQLVKLAIPKLAVEMIQDLNPEAKMAIIVDFLVRTTNQTAAFKVMEGMGAKGQMMESLGRSISSIGEELSQNLTGDGPEGGITG